MFGGGFQGFKFGFDGGQESEESNQQEQKNVDNQELYNILGVDKKADINEIKKAFKKACIKGDYRHPDKGGDPEKFKKLNEAYEVLSNPEKRDLYDKYGLDGLKEGGGPSSGNPFDLLSNLFGGGARNQGPKKAKPKQHTLEITLEDVFKGKYVKTSFKRLRTCDKCEGKGGQNAKVCPTCKGQKYVIKMVRLGPNAYSQTQQICDECDGKGDIMKDSDRCKGCQGKKIVENVKEIEVPIEPGVPHDYNYKFTGEADEGPGILAGDLYVKILIKKHKVFERVGADLYLNKNISLLEALSGVYYEIDHLDGSKVKIASAPGQYIQNGSIKMIKGKGMPFFKDAFSHGNLYIRFKVEFPKFKELKADFINQIKNILPVNKKQETLDKSKKHEFLQNYNENELNPNPKGGRKKQSEENGYRREGGGTQVQCSQQ